MAKAEGSKPTQAQSPKPKAQHPTPKSQHPTPNTQGPTPKAQSPKPKAQSPNPKAQSPKPKAQGPKPNTQHPRPKAQGPKPKAQGPTPNTQHPKPKAQGLCLPGTLSNRMELIEYGRKILRQEADSICLLAEKLDESFAQAVRILFECKGRVITCGVGKSGHVARKASGTLSSTGTPSIFLHASEAFHGDLGSVTAQDVVLLYTHSGETDEIVRLFPSLRVQGAKTILVTGRPNSSAGRAADLTLNTHVAEEACPNNLAPTTSTTAMMALSDALALVVMEMREFTAEDYAKLHPGGTLGRRLLLTVRDVMRTGPDLALVPEDATVMDVMTAINKAGAGAACVVDANGELAGFISDGDLRRHFTKSPDQYLAAAREVMTQSVTTIDPFLMAVEALEFFQTYYQTQPRMISEIPVIENKKVVGLLMLKDLLKSGIAI